nr:MFS transporter [Methylocella tundrae]
MADAVINPSGIIDQSPVGIFQLRVFVLCALVAALDGFDTQAIGYVAPLVASAIEIPISSFSLIFSAGLLGASVGAFAFGPLADRFGRKRLLVAACILFASFTLATIGVRSFQGLLALRFLAGLGLGGATPSFLALSAEFSPKRLRSLTITALFAAFPFGGFVGGFASSYLISHYGWQTVFVAGGVTPLLIAGLLAIWLPESLHFMASRGTDKAAVVAVLNRISPTPIPESASIAFPENPPETAPPVRGLFTEGRAPRTLLLGVPFFMGFMILVTVTAWTPLSAQKRRHSVVDGRADHCRQQSWQRRRHHAVWLSAGSVWGLQGIGAGFRRRRHSLGRVRKLHGQRAIARPDSGARRLSSAAPLPACWRSRRRSIRSICAQRGSAGAWEWDGLVRSWDRFCLADWFPGRLQSRRSSSPLRFPA